MANSIEASESVFVRARRRDVHPYLADVAGYGAWWPDCRSRPVGEGTAVALRAAPADAPRWRRARVQQLRLDIVKERVGLGIDLRVRGELDGTAEWYYLDEVDGVVVHWLLSAWVRRGSARGARATHRAAVRAGLHALKDLLESGRPPGREPSPALLADQQDAIAEFQAGVEAHHRRGMPVVRKEARE